MISIKALHKRFGNLNAIQQLDLELETSKVYALIGPNGSGKTTLLKCLLGLVIPSKGSIRVQGEDIQNQWKYREQIGYMPQIGHYPANMTIGQLLKMVVNVRKYQGVLDEELVHAFGLHAMHHKRMHTLSGGTRQKVSAAIAFLFNAPILILDEPTAGLDPLSVELLKEKIIKEKEAGKLLIISSHIMSDLDHIATEMVYLYDGQLMYNDSIDKLKADTGEERLGKAISAIMAAHLPHTNSTF